MDSTENWIVRFNAHASKPQMRLICFPFAGGGLSNYAKWRKDLNEQIELCAVNLPGRDRLIKLPCLTDYQYLISNLAFLLAHENDCPMIFFGHSYGGITAYFLSLQLKKIRAATPDHVFISATLPPTCPREQLASLDPHNFKDALINQYQGIPQEVLNCPELLDFFLPIIQNDFKMYEQYPEVLASFHDQLIDCNITSIGYSQDRPLEKDFLLWSNCTNQSHQHIHLPGGHFEIINNWKFITEKINHLFLDSKTN